MKCAKWFHTLLFFSWIAGCSALASAQNPQPETAAANPYYAFFTEKVLTVTREGDGLIPGTLRAALAQASGFRAQNSFTLVKIVFDPTVKRVRVTKGPLPEIDGALTTLDCQTPQGRGIIEGAIEDTEGLDPGEELAGLKITSTGNAVRNCHITGFPSAGILLRGTRNIIEYNTIGYHKDSPETTIPASAAYEEPKTNRGPGILIGAGANANVIQNNDIVANAFNGVEFSPNAGDGNKVLYNFFAKNSGKPIKAPAGGTRTPTPHITKITREGDVYVVQGSAEPKSEVQLYLVGGKDDEVGLNISAGIYTATEAFSVATKSKGFVPGQTKILALSQGQDGNTSEFSGAQAVPGPAPSGVIVSAAPEPESGAGAKPETETKSGSGEGSSDTVEVDIPEGESDAAPAQPSGEAPKKSTGSESTSPQAATSSSEPDTALNVKGLGDKGGPPDSGSGQRNSEISSLGI
jgi:hypothetical protein